MKGAKKKLERRYQVRKKVECKENEGNKIKSEISKKENRVKKKEKRKKKIKSKRKERGK